MKRFRAKFIGRINPLGYETGKVYDLMIKDKRSMLIMRTDFTGKCPYESLSAFLKNWTDIQTI